MDKKTKDSKESETTTRRIVSHLYFIREDLDAISKLDIKSPETREIVSELKEKAEKLFNTFMGREK